MMDDDFFDYVFQVLYKKGRSSKWEKASFLTWKDVIEFLSSDKFEAVDIKKVIIFNS